MTTMTEQMANMGKEILEDIRKNLVIPYIGESNDALKIGWSIKEGELVESESSPEGVFPDSLHGEKRNLLYYLDCVYKALFQDKRTTSTCAKMKEEAELEAALTTAESKLQLYANYRIACSEYLHMLAKSSGETFDKFIADENPHKLIGAVMALSLFYKDTAGRSIASHTGKLLAVHQRMHTA